ncbi:MAG: hypothetical protein ACOX47_04140 [Bacillota bacterium]
MSTIFQNIEKLVTNFQNNVIEIQQLATDFQKSIVEVQKLAANFHTSIMELQQLVERSIKIALVILALFIIFFLFREFFSWRMQVRLQKQNMELLQKMTSIIALLEESIKKK